jgi:hypothetical protein
MFGRIDELGMMRKRITPGFEWQIGENGRLGQQAGVRDTSREGLVSKLFTIE